MNNQRNVKRLMRKEDPCPRCGENKWRWIPDSLAQSCVCGAVRVEEDNGMFSPGISLQQWLKDLVEFCKK